MSDTFRAQTEQAGYATVSQTVTVHLEVVPVDATNHPLDTDAFGRLLAVADMADRGAGTDITALSDEGYLARLLG